MSTANTILAQIAALQASLAKAKIQERANYRANVRPPMVTAYKTLRNAGLDWKAAFAAVKTLEPTFAAASRPAIAAPASVPNHATTPRRNMDKMPQAQRDAAINNRQYFVGTEWDVKDTDRLYPTIAVNPKKGGSAGHYRFDILHTQPGITFGEFKRQLAAFQDAGHLWAGGKSDLKGEVTYNLNNGMLRLERA